jgi:hypothetical protein
MDSPENSWIQAREKNLRSNKNSRTRTKQKLRKPIIRKRSKPVVDDPLAEISKTEFLARQAKNEKKNEVKNGKANEVKNGKANEVKNEVPVVEIIVKPAKPIVLEGAWKKNILLDKLKNNETDSVEEPPQVNTVGRQMMPVSRRLTSREPLPKWMAFPIRRECCSRSSQAEAESSFEDWRDQPDEYADNWTPLSSIPDSEEERSLESEEIE